jgi:hypothetical protein
MRFSSKTFKKSLKKGRKARKTRKVKGQKKQRGGSAGSALYRDIPKEATFSDAPTDGLE